VLHAHSIARLNKLLKNNTPYEVEYSVSDTSIVKMRMFSYSLIELEMVFTWNMDGHVIDSNECGDGEEIVVSCKDTEFEEDDEEVDDEPEPDENVIPDPDEKATAPDSYMNFMIITPGDVIRMMIKMA